MFVHKMDDLTVCINYLEKHRIHVPQVISLLQLMKTSVMFRMTEYTFYCAVELGFSSDKPACIVAECKPSVRTEYHVYVDDQRIREIQSFLSSKVDWKKTFNRFDSLPLDQLSLITEVAERNGARLEADVPVQLDTYVLKDITHLPEIVCIDIVGADVKQLTADEGNIVNSNWEYKYVNSESRIRGYLEKGVGYGLYVKDELVSWAVLNHRGKIAFVHTVSYARRRGYSCIVVNKLVRHLLTLGLIPMADIAKSNTASKHMFCDKLGFELLIECGTLTYCPE